jgi:hypothetical protein
MRPNIGEGGWKTEDRAYRIEIGKSIENCK